MIFAGLNINKYFVAFFLTIASIRLFYNYRFKIFKEDYFIFSLLILMLCVFLFKSNNILPHLLATGTGALVKIFIQSNFNINDVKYVSSRFIFYVFLVSFFIFVLNILAPSISSQINLLFKNITNYGSSFTFGSILGTHIKFFMLPVGIWTIFHFFLLTKLRFFNMSFLVQLISNNRAGLLLMLIVRFFEKIRFNWKTLNSLLFFLLLFGPILGGLLALTSEIDFSTFRDDENWFLIRIGHMIGIQMCAVSSFPEFFTGCYTDMFFTYAFEGAIVKEQEVSIFDFFLKFGYLGHFLFHSAIYISLNRNGWLYSPIYFFLIAAFFVNPHIGGFPLYLLLSFLAIVSYQLRRDLLK